MKYLFVYNADSGLANALVDYGKKIISPSKYDCQLCAVTYGPFGMKQDWKKFVKTLGGEVEFLHRDEYEAKFPKQKIDYPSVVKLNNGETNVLLNSADFKKIKSLKDLTSALAKQ